MLTFRFMGYRIETTCELLFLNTPQRNHFNTFESEVEKTMSISFISMKIIFPNQPHGLKRLYNLKDRVYINDKGIPTAH